MEEKKTFTTKVGTRFDYTNYRQIAEKIECQQQISNQTITHSGPHKCKKQEKDHLCVKRCPECESICTKEYGHSGKHQPHQHRNKDQQIFTALKDSDVNKKIVIKEAGEVDRVYQPMDSCQPETCSKSCLRRSRAHFHLVDCKGGFNCLQRRLGIQKARHQKQQYHGSEKFYDEILCEDYWNDQGWEHPVNNDSRDEISLCNYYCCLCGELDKKFCIKQAWHTQSQEYKDHVFTCQNEHKSYGGVDVQFVIDTTGSMSDYIEMAKKTVIRLMESTKPFVQRNPNEVLYSVVSYKDHDYPQVCQSLNFGSHVKAIDFISNLTAGPGGQDTPEAMLDGLDLGVSQAWRLKSKKFLFLIADAPPHGVPRFHNMMDNYPRGCPCGLTEEVVFQRIQAQKIQVVILKLDDYLNQTIEVFQNLMPSLEVMESITNEEYTQKIQQLICRELNIMEITLKRD